MKLAGVVIAFSLFACGSKDKAPAPADKPAPVDKPAPPPADKPAPTPVDDPQLAPNAPKDQVKTVDAAKTARIAELTAEAKKTWPDAKARYTKGLPKGEIFFVTATLVDGPRHETAFVQVKSIKGGKISGTIANELVQVTSYKNTDPYTLDEADIVDWLISKPDGSEEGNLVGKYLDTQQ